MLKYLFICILFSLFCVRVSCISLSFSPEHMTTKKRQTSTEHCVEQGAACELDGASRCQMDSYCDSELSKCVNTLPLGSVCNSSRQCEGAFFFDVDCLSQRCVLSDVYVAGESCHMGPELFNGGCMDGT